MAYDPCGTTRLEGEEILRRLAKYLGVDPIDLKQSLTTSAQINKAVREINGPVSD